MERIGLIAGNGKFPFLVLDAARARGYDVVVAAIKEETLAEIESHGAAAVHPVLRRHGVRFSDHGRAHQRNESLIPRTHFPELDQQQNVIGNFQEATNHKRPTERGDLEE